MEEINKRLFPDRDVTNETLNYEQALSILDTVIIFIFICFRITVGLTLQHKLIVMNNTLKTRLN